MNTSLESYYSILLLTVSMPVLAVLLGIFFLEYANLDFDGLYAKYIELITRWFTPLDK